MKSFISIVLTLISINSYSQQVIELCDDDTTKVFTYSTDAGVPGIYYWTIDNEVPIIDGPSYDVVWGERNLGTHTISVEFEDRNGCTSESVYMTVEVIICQITTMWIPNCFTPDGDANNNVWNPIGYNYIDAHYFIANRWGEIIFESYNLSYGWDGTYKGSMCQDGVYVYYLDWKDYKNRRFSRNGHITLLR